MFSPDPDKNDAHFGAVVWYADRSSEKVELPQLERMNLFQRTYKERWRKYLQDNLGMDDHSWMYPFFARYIAQTHYRNGKRPVAVELVKEYSKIPEPDLAFGGKTDRQWKEHYFYNYMVRPGDFPQ